MWIALLDSRAQLTRDRCLGTTSGQAESPGPFRTLILGEPQLPLKSGHTGSVQLWLRTASRQGGPVLATSQSSPLGLDGSPIRASSRSRTDSGVCRHPLRRPPPLSPHWGLCHFVLGEYDCVPPTPISVPIPSMSMEGQFGTSPLCWVPTRALGHR